MQDDNDYRREPRFNGEEEAETPSVPPPSAVTARARRRPRRGGWGLSAGLAILLAGLGYFTYQQFELLAETETRLEAAQATARGASADVQAKTRETESLVARVKALKAENAKFKRRAAKLAKGAAKGKTSQRSQVEKLKKSLGAAEAKAKRAAAQVTALQARRKSAQAARRAADEKVVKFSKATARQDATKAQEVEVLKKALSQARRQVRAKDDQLAKLKAAQKAAQAAGAAGAPQPAKAKAPSKVEDAELGAVWKTVDEELRPQASGRPRQ